MPKNRGAKESLVSRSAKRGQEALHKSPLAKDAAKEIWELESDEEDIAVDVGAKDGGGE